MNIILPAIICAIILFQIFFFVKNVHRMDEYRHIFDDENSWYIQRDRESGFVVGISSTEEMNAVFKSIVASINKYLRSNSGSVIDFHLIKDAADRHCDAVENDINTLTPVPLYCGLAGTMIGVIVGLSSLLYTGSIMTLLSSGSDDFGTAAHGVNDLLFGVAWAMSASICGIIFTTLSSILFKRSKLAGESGKNTFFAWLQATLLPELPSATSDVLNGLVKNLNNFNMTFAQNTTSLRNALGEVNESYRIQSEVIKAVYDMDVMKMAKANVNVLKELSACTGKLEQFNQYLSDIQGYTNAIHEFVSLFEQEANRLYMMEDMHNLLKEIQQYFMRHKAEISKDAGDVDMALRDALTELKDGARENVNSLNRALVQQAEDFKQILSEEKDSFEKMSGEMAADFSNRLQQVPAWESKLSEISSIPEKIDLLISKMEESNAKLASNVSSTMQQTASEIAASVSNLSEISSIPEKIDQLISKMEESDTKSLPVEKGEGKKKVGKVGRLWLKLKFWKS